MNMRDHVSFGTVSISELELAQSIESFDPPNLTKDRFSLSIG